MLNPAPHMRGAQQKSADDGNGLRVRRERLNKCRDHDKPEAARRHQDERPIALDKRGAANQPKGDWCRQQRQCLMHQGSTEGLLNHSQAHCEQRQANTMDKAECAQARRVQVEAGNACIQTTSAPPKPIQHCRTPVEPWRSKRQRIVMQSIFGMDFSLRGSGTRLCSVTTLVARGGEFHLQYRRCRDQGALCHNVSPAGGQSYTA